jgi:hypothetical protein
MEGRYVQTVRDVFLGAPEVLSLSARYALGIDVTDDDIRAALPAGALPAIRYAEERHGGRVRRTTGEPAVAHPVDVALRSVDLGYGEGMTIRSILHDVIEDRCPDLATITRGKRDLEERFGAEVAHDVAVLTNAYGVAIDEIKPRLPTRMPFSDESLQLMVAALREHRAGLEESVARDFARVFDELDHYLPTIDVARGAERARFDAGYTVLGEASLQCYGLYVQSIADETRRRLGDGQQQREAVIVVKFLDVVDNLRTAEVATWRPLEKLLLKAEAFLDRSYYLSEELRQRSLTGTFDAAYDYTKTTLVGQLDDRRRALGYLADSRFAPLGRYLSSQVERLQEKYKVASPVETLRRLREEIRASNGSN